MIDNKKRLNISIDAELHKRLKLTAAEHDTTIVDIVSEAIKDRLDKINEQK